MFYLLLFLRLHCAVVNIVGAHIFGADEARYFKFGLQIERKEYWHYSSSMGVHSGSRDLLKFSEISANISETVQDRYNGRLIGNHMCPIEWHCYQTISGL